MAIGGQLPPGAPDTVIADKFVLLGDGERATPPEPVTFLGVKVTGISPALTDQLGLAKGMGLVVSQILPESPATGVLKQHDILLKLNDQLLIEQRQLSVLVQSRKEGDDVSLTIVRAGKESVVKVKLGKHTPPPVTFRFEQFAPGWSTSADEMQRLDDVAAEVRKRRAMRVETIGKGGGIATFSSSSGSKPVDFDEAIKKIADKTSAWRVKNKDGTLELKREEGQKLEFTATDPKGKVTFKGPVETPEDRKAVPPELLQRLQDQLTRVNRLPAEVRVPGAEFPGGGSPAI